LLELFESGKKALTFYASKSFLHFSNHIKRGYTGLRYLRTLIAVVACDQPLTAISNQLLE
jgi:hypothetical protein